MRYLILISLFVCACSTVEQKDTKSAEGLYKVAQELEKQERYEEALTNYNEIKNKFPYNKLAVESKLNAADIHFLRESFTEAESAYKTFKELHPSHPRSDYVTFRIGLSLYKQLPESIDRDFSSAIEAQKYFHLTYSNYPDGDFAGSARDHELKCKLKLARKIEYVAEFYKKREMYDSALGRYEELLSSYPDVGLRPKALFSAAFCAYKNKNLDTAKKYYTELVNEFPSSSWTGKAKKEMSNAF